MNMHANHKSELRPLPMRITQMQFERLQNARQRDGLSVQEHVRRSLDFYLSKIERDSAKAGVPPGQAEPPDEQAEPVTTGAKDTGSAGGKPDALAALASAMPVRKGPPKRRPAPRVVQR